MKGQAVRLIAILLLPLAGLGSLWAMSDNLSRQGTVWEVEIEGYDPRDLLRGHYVEFRYDWPIVEAEEDDQGEEEARNRRRWRAAPLRLCLIGQAPKLVEAVKIAVDDDAALEACEHPVVAQPSSVYGNSSLARGRLYVGQDRAKQIEDELRNRDQRGIVTFRQRDDGVLTPLDIRFRPLTAAELAEREEAAPAVVADPIAHAGEPGDEATVPVPEEPSPRE